MDNYRTIKCIEALNSKRLADAVERVLSRKRRYSRKSQKQNYLQCGCPEYAEMILKEDLTGEKFLANYTFYVAKYLKPEQQQHLTSLISWILENPKIFYYEEAAANNTRDANSGIQREMHYENIPNIQRNAITLSPPVVPPRKFVKVNLNSEQFKLNDLSKQTIQNVPDTYLQRSKKTNGSGKFRHIAPQVDYKPIRERLELPNLKYLQISLSSTNNNQVNDSKPSVNPNASINNIANNTDVDAYEKITAVVYESTPVVNRIPSMLKPFLSTEKPALPKKPAYALTNSMVQSSLHQSNVEERRIILDINREDGIKILENEPEGSFVLRTSSSQYCTLMVKSDSRIANIQIARKDGKYYLYSGNVEKPKIEFNNLESLVNCYKLTELPLIDLKLTLQENYNFKYSKGVFHLPNFNK